MVNKVILCCLASPMNLPNLPAGDEEGFQPLLPMPVGVLFPDGCVGMNEAG